MKQSNKLIKARWGKLLSIDDAGEYIGISPKTIRNELSKGTFPVRPKSRGKRVLFLRDDLDRFAEDLPYFGGR